MLKKIEVTRDTLTMHYPASWWRDTWREALVCGNGRMGASFYGGTRLQTIMITDGELWYGGFEDTLPDVHDALERMRAKMDRGEYREASWEIVNELREKGYQTTLESPLPLADIKIEIDPKGGFQEYQRALNMETGEASCQWTDSGVLYRCDGFVSRADGIAVYRIRAQQPVISASFRTEFHRNPGTPIPETCRTMEENAQPEASDGYLTYQSINTDGLRYGMAVRITTNGKQKIQYGRIYVEEADEIVLTIRSFIKDAGGDGIHRTKTFLSRLPESYESLFSRHVPLHRRKYLSARLELDGWQNTDNEDLLSRAYQDKQPPELMEKMWKYGRYLFISGTDETADPFPLYGLWGGGYDLIWSHNMANENTQMIYWHSFVGNLADYHRALFRYYNDRMDIYRENAKKLFGCRGIYMTAGTTPHVSTPSQVVPVIINWVGAAGWLAQHYCTYASYRPEEEEYIRKEICPYLEETAAFYEDFIRYNADGTIRLYPSVSPENTPQNFMPPLTEMIAHPMPTTINSTIDLAVIKEFFSGMIRLGKRYGMYQDKIEDWEKILASIPPYRSNDLGAIREWQAPQFEDRYDHRHLSHIYPVFPGHEVNSIDQPEEMKKYEKAVSLRKIDAQTGWSMAHMASIYARFNEGEKAAECLDNMAKSCLLSNFFTLHNDWRGMSVTLDMDPAPVQLDAALGYVNAVQEMLVYVSEDLVRLLPALPKRLKKGSLWDFQYPGGSISMKWDLESRSFRVCLKAARPHSIRLSLPDAFGPVLWETGNVEENRDGKTLLLSFEQEGKTAEGGCGLFS